MEKGRQWEKKEAYSRVLGEKVVGIYRLVVNNREEETCKSELVVDICELVVIYKWDEVGSNSVEETCTLESEVGICVPVVIYTLELEVDIYNLVETYTLESEVGICVLVVYIGDEEGTYKPELVVGTCEQVGICILVVSYILVLEGDIYVQVETYKLELVADNI